MNKIVSWGAAFGLAGLASLAHATNGDQMLGTTAQQWGMAGAVVANPTDAGTAITNPAGLTTLDMEAARFDLGFGLLNPPRKVNGTESDSNYYLIPGGAGALKLSDRLTFGMGMSGLSGMGVDVPLEMGNNPQVVTTKQFYKIAPGFGYRITENLSLGAAFNLDYQSLAIAMYAGNPTDPTNAKKNLQLPQDQAYGYGATLGLTYDLSRQWRLGLAYTTRQEMNEFRWNSFNGEYRMDMDAPPTLAAGVAFKPDSTLLIEADVKRIWFSQVLDEIDLETPAGTQTMEYGWDDQTVFALGIQKDVTAATTVRVGYNYGASPIDEEDVTSNYGSLAVTEHHASAGLTQRLKAGVSGSVSYVRAFHNAVSDDAGNEIELEQNIVNLQLSYRH